MTPTRTLTFVTTMTICSLFALVVPAKATTITLLPNTTLSAAPGETIGWGYEIEGDAVLDAVFVSAAVNPLPAAQVSAATASLFDFPFVLAGTTVTLPYDPIGLFGLVQITLAPTATPGSSIVGSVFGEFELFDPVNGTLAVPFSVSFTVNVTGSTDAAVPEPSTVILLGGGLGVVLLGRGIRRGRRVFDRGQTGVKPGSNREVASVS